MTEETNTIFVGKNKPLMAYVFASEKVSKASKTVKIVARGVLISDAVTIAEIFMRRLGKHEYTAEINSIEMTNKYGKQVFVSTMSITVTV
jgi:DNA-binding protein Alba